MSSGPHDPLAVELAAALRTIALLRARIAELERDASPRPVEPKPFVATPACTPTAHETTPALVDIPLAWELTRATKPDQHHEKCSYRVAAMLCDCAAFGVMCEVSRRFKAIASSAPPACTGEPPPAGKPMTRYKTGGYGAMVEDENGPYVRFDALPTTTKWADDDLWLRANGLGTGEPPRFTPHQVNDTIDRLLTWIGDERMGDGGLLQKSVAMLRDYQRLAGKE